jgi:hypothetical protein
MRHLRRLFPVVAVAGLAIGMSCGTGEVNSEDAARLSLAGPANLEMFPGESVDLAWLLVRQSSGPEQGHTLVFTVIAAGDHGCSISAPNGVTDAAGLAGTTFTAGDHTLVNPVQVQGAVTSIPVSEYQPPPVAFTISVVEPMRMLRPEPPDRTRYDGLTGGRVQLAVKATTGEARPLPGEDIQWEVVTGGGGGARFPVATTQTDLRGISIGDLECGLAPATVTVRATMAGTAPVELTVQVTEWGTCDDTHPCPRGWECEGGACVETVPDCTDDDDCPDDMRCRFGECVTAATGDGCKTDAECDPGETCVAGVCTGCEGVECPCETVDDCPDGFICVDGACVCDGPDCGGDPPGCDVEDPDLEGFWDVDSVLRLRESLPGWLDELMGVLGPVFRFLSDGMIDGFDFDIPIIGDALEEAADSLVGRYVPPWVGELLRAIADLNDILSTFHVVQEMNIWGAGVHDQYLGELEWREVEMTWRGELLRGRFDDITGVYLDPDDIEAEAICGTFYVHRHDVSVGFGSVVRWVLDVIVTIVTEGEYFSLEDLLLSLVDVCDDVAVAIDDLAYDLADGLGITLPDVYDIVYRLCESGVESGTDAAIRWLEDLMVRDDAMSLGGWATISGPDSLTEGRWEGTLLGGDFTGDWTAARR